MDSLNFHHFESKTDEAVALDVEGYPVHETYFSDTQWELNHEFQKVLLTYRDDKAASDLEMSRMLRKPISVMKQKVKSLLTGISEIGEANDLKFMIYSAHDDTVINMLNFLAVDYHWIPFAATVTYELKYSVSCLADE